jgi:ABC-2 type transport system ATP-binding protein
MNIIEVSNLSKVYLNPLTRKQKRAVDGISFTVEQGQVFGFLGPNGSGKTTTIGMLLDIINRTNGEIALFGSTNLNAARKRMGATLETPNFYPYLSGYDNLKIVAHIKRVSEERIQEILRTVKLADRQRDKFKSYSLGMKQRLALASAMLSDPELIILDEPANGLDPEGIREIREIIKDLGRSGKTVFLSSHLLDEVEQTCTHVAVIKEGRLLTSGSVKELTSQNAAVRLQANDLDALKHAVTRYPKTLSASIRNASVYAALEDSNVAALNKFLAGEGIFVSHLSEERQSLEEVFLELTR